MHDGSSVESRFEPGNPLAPKPTPYRASVLFECFKASGNVLHSTFSYASTICRVACLVLYYSEKNQVVCIVTDMESRFPAILVLWLGRDIYRGSY
ncbi:hypothetical protein AVEN_135115-1 [Araneus ventricosus]|uniref:Uncharacterized protein n=1 Tax=Araneus ventricosus TaxID=182803 RepID=A0A4Y2B2Z5_ARAVE|nr:hypothetical protein AVEN_135115-1 [Araneus ventricosus]